MVRTEPWSVALAQAKAQAMSSGAERGVEAWRGKPSPSSPVWGDVSPPMRRQRAATRSQHPPPGRGTCPRCGPRHGPRLPFPFPCNSHPLPCGLWPPRCFALLRALSPRRDSVSRPRGLWSVSLTVAGQIVQPYGAHPLLCPFRAACAIVRGAPSRGHSLGLGGVSVTSSAQGGPLRVAV